MKKIIQKSILALAVTALYPSHGKTQIFVEAGLATQEGSDEGSGVPTISQSINFQSNVAGSQLANALLTNGAAGALLPSNGKASGVSLNTGLNHFFPFNTCCAATVGFIMGYTLLKSQSTPKKVTLYGLNNNGLVSSL